MKRTAMILFVLFNLLSLIGCSKNQKVNTNESSTNKIEEPVKEKMVAYGLSSVKEFENLDPSTSNDEDSVDENNFLISMSKNMYYHTNVSVEFKKISYSDAIKIVEENNKEDNNKIYTLELDEINQIMTEAGLDSVNDYDEFTFLEEDGNLYRFGKFGLIEKGETLHFIRVFYEEYDEERTLEMYFSYEKKKLEKMEPIEMEDLKGTYKSKGDNEIIIDEDGSGYLKADESMECLYLESSNESSFELINAEGITTDLLIHGYDINNIDTFFLVSQREDRKTFSVFVSDDNLLDGHTSWRKVSDDVDFGYDGLKEALDFGVEECGVDRKTASIRLFEDGYRITWWSEYDDNPSAVNVKATSDDEFVLTRDY